MKSILNVFDVNKKLIIFFVLANFVTGVFSQTLGYGTVRLDGDGHLLSRTIPENKAYDIMLKRQWNFWLSLPANYSGKPMYYFYCGFRDNNPNMPDNWTNDVGEKIPVMVRSALAYYAYTGDTLPLKNIIDFAEYTRSNSLTASNANWPNMPVTTADAGELVYNGEKNPSGGTWPDYEIHVDQAADMAYAYFRLYLYNGNTNFRDMAINVANVLVSKIQTGNESNSPLPYIVNSTNGSVIASYTSNLFQTIELFDELIAANLGNVSSYQTARTSIKNWLLQYPMKNGKWVDAHGDLYITDNSNLSNTTKSNACLYLLDNPTFDSNFAVNIPKLLQWTEDNMSCTCPDSYITYGAHVPAEQNGYKIQMGYQTARLAAEYALWHMTSGNVNHKDIAYHSANYWTYMVDDNGMARDGNSDNVGWWFSDCYGEATSMFYYVYKAFPEWAPPGENHILYAKGVLKDVNYSSSQIQYTTTDENGEEYLRLSFLPSTITLGVNTLSLRNDLNAPGYTVKDLGNGDYAIAIKRLASGKVVIKSGGVPIPVTSLTITPANTTINVNETIKLTASILPVNATNKNVTWQSVNSGIASVNSSGYITGVSAGITKIIATTQDGNKKDTCDIIINTTVIGNSIFTTQLPSSTDNDSDYELGMKFRSSVSGTISKIRFYKPAGETGSHTGRIWSSTGTQLTSVVFTGETASGWQEMALTSPLNITSNTTYIVSVNANSVYPLTSNGLQTSIVNGVLSSIADGANGVFNETVGVFPNQSWNNSNYFRDIVFNSIVTSVENTFESEKIKIYPNPSTGIINIKAPVGSNIEITNMFGSKIFSGKLTDNYKVIDLSGKSGVYFININKGNVLHKMIIK